MLKSLSKKQNLRTKLLRSIGKKNIDSEDRFYLSDCAKSMQFEKHTDFLNESGYNCGIAH
ncbi:MAG: hypothetical protein BAJATHORv1_40318 [Candidatus Thorarchaeota archaeon]|nr:MAG: hypothetical protein BAJATHORv1_40318 [Candidatus Thorarchaeota archaeon]